MLTSADIRQQFLSFFREKGHTIVPSAPIVIKNDPTLLFTNAGMNQFKDYFLGNRKPEHLRVADTQKCLRVSGKHNDLEEVGVDTYHHTMFEMLGNWSFGDYFKKEAIAWSWELLTDVYKLDKDRLYVTVFEGDEKERLAKDEEAYNEWKKVIAEDRILSGNKKDNFWEMGDTGPCGPCSEIHFDSRSDEERKLVAGSELVNSDHPQVIEIWNNVFMQFNRLKDGSLEPLPARHVDTGMGFERLVRVIQGKQSNYDTDVFAGTIAETEKITGKKYDYSDSKEAVAFRVLADHIRTIAFTIADGQLPSSNGAGYVVRRVLRRAVRYYHTYLDYKQPLLFQLIPIIAEQFRNVFPELHKQLDFVSKVTKEEEEAFLRTLEKGLKRLFEFPMHYWMGIATSQFGDQYDPENSDRANWIHVRKNAFVQDQLNAKVPIQISGKVAFELFDTYGFPLDLTTLIAKERNWTVDEIGFKKELQQQKERSRAAGIIDTTDWVVLREEPNVVFTGYDELETIAHVIKYRKVTAKGKEQFQIVLDKTPFYAESGGQVGDKGELVFPDGEIVQVTDTKKENGLTVHFTNKLPEDISDALTAIVDPSIRRQTNSNHSATHLLHAAMKQVLGTHVNQKGSLVNADYLRFDFSHFTKVTDEELVQIEAIVNQKVRENITLKEERGVLYAEAIGSGVTALFGEKYGEYVRIITFDDTFSKELCGGTHVQATGEIGFFKIIAEAAVAAGVRRIEAVTGAAAEAYINDQLKTLHSIKNIFKNPKEIIKTIEKIVVEKNDLEKRIQSIEEAQTNEIIKKNGDKVQVINGLKVISFFFEVNSQNVFRNVYNYFRNNSKDSVIILGASLRGSGGFELFVYHLNSKNDNYIMNLNTSFLKGMLEDEQVQGGGNNTLYNVSGYFKKGVKNIIDVVNGEVNTTLNNLGSLNNFLAE